MPCSYSPQLFRAHLGTLSVYPPGVSVVIDTVSKPINGVDREG